MPRRTDNLVADLVGDVRFLYNRRAERRGDPGGKRPHLAHRDWRDTRADRDPRLGTDSIQVDTSMGLAGITRIRSAMIALAMLNTAIEGYREHHRPALFFCTLAMSAIMIGMSAMGGGDHVNITTGPILGHVALGLAVAAVASAVAARPFAWDELAMSLFFVAFGVATVVGTRHLAKRLKPNERTAPSDRVF